MNKFVVAIFLLPLAQGAASAQTGDAKAGKAFWDGPTAQCRNCHGEKGEGAFGPDLAGRKLTVPQFAHAIRKPWGIMPAYIDSQVTDAEIANMVAYFDSLPANAQPGKWRFEVPADAARGQMVSLNVGCGQCHGPILNGPRQNMGAIDGTFEDFKGQVYDHTTTYPPHRKRLEEPMPVRVRMGNFNPARVWETQLREIYDWAKNDLGFRAMIAGRLRKGEPGANGVTYRLDVENLGLKDKGKVAEGLTVGLILPAGANVVSTTGTGYVGVEADQKAKANVAVWKLARLGQREHQTFTITLSKPGTKEDNLRGTVRWTSPAVKTGPFDQANIAPAPL